MARPRLGSAGSAPLFAVLFLVMPLIELYVIIQVGGAIGAWNTIGILLLDSIIGGWLMKREGLGIMRRVQEQLGLGRVPGKELVDAFLILFGGALMLTPGFVTDIVGILLLLPPVRAVVRASLAKRFRVIALNRSASGGPAGPGGYIDL